MKEGGGFFGEDARDDFDAVIEARVGEDFETGAHRATFGVVRSVNEARNASLNHGASTHGAGFERDIERCVGESVVGENAGSFAKNHDFCVSGRIVVANGAIAGASNDIVLVDKNGTDGNLTGFGGGSRFIEGELHVVEIGRH